MKQRVLTSLGIGVVVIPIMILSKYIVYPIFLGLISVIAVWELLRTPTQVLRIMPTTWVHCSALTLNKQRPCRKAGVCFWRKNDKAYCF